MISIVLIANSCVSISTPPNNEPFVEIHSLKQVEGIYQNKGIGDDPEHPPFLSEFIWSQPFLDKYYSLNHKKISAIEVLVSADSKINFMALDDNNTILHSSTFTNGEDFELKKGKIIIYSGWHLLEAADDPLAGPKYARIELGLDTQGRFKYRNIGGGAGLVYMVIPLAIVGKYEARFKKIK